LIVLDRPPYRIEIGRAVVVSLGDRKVIAETVAQISPKEMAEKLGISVKEAENLKIDLLERLKHDRNLFSSQSRVFDWKKALEGLRADEKLKVLSYFPEGGRDAEVIERAQEEGIIKDSIEKMRASERAHVAYLILRDYGIFEFVSIRGRKEDLYATDGHLLLDARSAVERMVRKLLGVYATNEVVNEAYSRFFSSSKPISEDQLNPVRYLAVGNGIIDLEEFRFSDPKGYYFTSWLDVDVDPEFLERLRRKEIEVNYFRKGEFLPLFERFYTENGEVTKDYVTLLDVLGSILRPRSLRLMAIIVGEPATGKTTLSRALQLALGDLCAPVRTIDLSRDPFSLERLLGARVVVSSEEVTDEVIDADMIKTIVGGDPISVNRKHRPRIDLRKNVLKVIVFANRVPQFSQVDQGFLERVRIIRTRNPLEEEEREPIRDEYLEKMKKEVIEFLLWCSFRLKEKGDIIEDMDPVEKFRMITRMSNPLRPFIDTALIVDREAEEKGTDLYEAYLEWASRRAVKVLGRDKFYEYLQREFPAIQRHHALWFLGCRIRRF